MGEASIGRPAVFLYDAGPPDGGRNNVDTTAPDRSLSPGLRPLPSIEPADAGRSCVQRRPFTPRKLEYTVARQSNQDPQKHSQRRVRILRVPTWPVAAKLVGLCVGVAAVLAIGLTALGYTQASAGLKQQAEAALYSDGLLVANEVDSWHDKNSTGVEELAEMPWVQRTLSAG